MQKILMQLKRDERGLSTMEYAVLFVIIVVGAVGFWSVLGDNLATQVDTGTGTFNTTLDGHQE